jgi:uroporphyrinogen decarboxylase
MPEGGFYYDQLKFPLQGNISVKDILDYPFPDPDDRGWFKNMKNRLNWIRQNTDCAAVVGVPAPFIHFSQYLRGFQDWYMDFIRNPKLLNVLFDAILEVNTRIARNILKEVGTEADIIFVADDIGTQNGLMVSYQHYKKHIHPRLERYFGMIHDLTPAKIHFHSCGSLTTIIEDLIQIGVDILNPVQVRATGMDPIELKKKYGNRLVFWGAIDTQHVLPYENVEEVKKEVERRVEELGKGGGYVLGAVHNIQPDVSAENIAAMFRHARDYRPSFSQ